MEKRFVSNRYLDLTSTAMSEVDVLARRYPDLINFSLGDPDLITEDVIIDGAMLRPDIPITVIFKVSRNL